MVLAAWNEYIPSEPPGISMVPDSWKLSDLLGITVNVFMGTGYALGFVSMGYSGILYSLSRGDIKETGKAWDAFLWGIIAILVSTFAVVFKNIVAALADVNSKYITNDLPGF